PIAVNLTVTDPDGDPITTLTVTNKPTGATFSTGAGNTSAAFNWTPTFGQSGSYTVTFTAANALSGSSSIEITIGDVDRAPVISAMGTAFTVADVHLAVVASVFDPDGEPIATITATNLPPGATFSHTANNRS